MVSAPVAPLSLEMFLSQPETKPAREWFVGQVMEKPMPQGKHSRLQMKLGTFLNEALENQQIALALPELRCTFAGRSIIPDIAVIPWDRLPVDPDGNIANTIDFCPAWLIEILSPDQPQTYLIRKILDSFEHGCQMGWIIDPQEQVVFAYAPPDHLRLFAQPEQTIAMPEWATGIPLTVATLFGWMQVKLS